MGPEEFMLLCHKLRGTGIVKDTIRSTVEEQVAKFLHIIGHNVKSRTVSFFFTVPVKLSVVTFTMFYEPSSH